MLISREHKVWGLYIGARVFGGNETHDYSGMSFERSLAIHAFLRQDCYDYYGGPFTEIKAILRHSGEFRASESYLMSSTQNEWTVFRSGFVLEQPVFSLHNYPPNMERPPVSRSPFTVSEAEAQNMCWVWKSGNVFKGFS